MKTTAKIGLYGAALALTFTSAYGIGAVGDPLTGKTPSAPSAAHQESNAMNHGNRHTGQTPPLPGGLQISQDGYTLDLLTPRLAAGQKAPLRFAIKDEAGKAVTKYARAHDKDLHLIVASRDLNTFRHLHPALGSDGTWSTPVDLPAAGDYRVFADFTPAGQGAKPLTLGADLAVAGPYQPRKLPPQKATAEVDGYTVTLDGTLTAGKMTGLTLSVAKGGKPVTDLEPYLGAYGHLVALRSGDLAYLHVHPEGEPGDGSTQPGPGISFMATAPTNGAYRLFLDFKHQGTVRTAAFTLHTTNSPAPAPTAQHEDHTSAEHQ
ncbi:hypothetical protein AR457_39440 [Streptomyces agglomeratus]|uniref:hypothetical protein n=1 Tax=Streptomyces agglomeratus TaxID=285458 RepID=UPI0008525290|nr:hypothetical protein [Streptomyces agglomeratus]OEJ21994.1 hypothetical protein AR457_39440 [Streptomyces agglomeratus]OEJ56759.1 hypothetical protein BGM19_00495 [Streptomyces agglomeratus]